MQYAPHAYQAAAQRWIAEHPRCALYLDMGLGKTVATATAVQALVQASGQRVLVVGPKRVVDHTWPAELAKWDHLRGIRLQPLTGTPAQRVRAVAAGAPWSAINYELLPWLVDHCGKGWPFDVVILDESSRMKSHNSARFKSLRKVRNRITRMVQLTGTPAPNGLLDLWAPAYLLDAGERLGRSYTAYRDHFFVGDYMGWSYEPRPGAAETVHGLLADVALSMSAADYLAMPDCTTHDVEVTLPPAAARAYRDMERQLVADLEAGLVTAANAAVASSKCLQIASGAVYDEAKQTHTLHGAKLDALESILEEAAGEPVLLFYQFRHERERIAQRFPETTFIEDGGSIELWNAGALPLLAMHPASGGHGLNLQSGGRLVVWFSPPWNLEQYQQANARLHRQGQTRPVRIYRLLAAGTLDHAVAARLASKCSVQDALMTALGMVAREAA